MSHFTQVETKINDLVALKAALLELGLAFEEATENQLVKVRGWKGSTLTAEAKIKASKSYDIGLQLTEEGTYKLVADWWGIEEETNEEAAKVQQRIIQCYAKHKVKAEVEELLVRQAGIEKQLLEVQREVWLTLEDVYRLEALLDATERERFGLPPRPKP